ERLDLSDVNARLAREKGCRFVIDTDAHAVRQLDLMRYGVFQARRAGLTKGDVLNALPYERFREALAARRTRRPIAAAARAAAPAARARPAANGPAKAAGASARKPAPAPSGRSETTARKVEARRRAAPSGAAKSKPAKSASASKRSGKRSPRG